MIVDAFLYFQERDMALLRMYELSRTVDLFVIVESTVTHSGQPKPITDFANDPEFAPFRHQMRHVVVTDLPSGDTFAATRRREMMQRNAILRGLYDVPDDAILMISDCDEIPRAEMIIRNIEDGDIIIYRQRLHYYSVNHVANAALWHGTRLCRVADARALSPHIVRYGIAHPDTYPRYLYLNDGGWHFSYFGGDAAVKRKLTSFLHQEMVTDQVIAQASDRIARGQDIYGRDEYEFTVGRVTDLPVGCRIDAPRFAQHWHERYRPQFHEDWYDRNALIWLEQLAHMTHHVSGEAVEIGCWEGRSTIVLANAIAPSTLHAVDHWRGNTDESPDHPAAIAAAERDVYATFSANVERLTAGNVQVHRGDWYDYAEANQDTRYRFVHLDASHDYDSVYGQIAFFLPRLEVGGIMCGDDAYAESVISAVRDGFGDQHQVVGGRLWWYRRSE